MPLITDEEQDNMKLEAEDIVRKLFEEYKTNKLGDRLDATLRGPSQNYAGTQGRATAQELRPAAGGSPSTPASPITPQGSGATGTHGGATPQNIPATPASRTA